MLSYQDIMDAPQEEISEIHPDDAIKLGAMNGIFFNRFFLPETFPLAPAQYHYDVVTMLDDPVSDHKALKIFRDGAKTTFARSRALKKVCYGLCDTGLIISSARPHAKKTIDWLSKKVKHNKQIKQVFGLFMGDRDSQDEIEIINPLFENHRTFFQAQGITGQIRGLNVGDSRPDFILCDDPCDEENTGTEEQIIKINEAFFGALSNSLAARSMNPTSEIVLLQTILAKGDLIDSAMKDSSFTTMEVGIFNDNYESAWPSKWSTSQLLKKKQGFIERNQLYLWLREYEGRLVDDTNAAFKRSWIKTFENYDDIPEGSVYFISCDPVPPPKSDANIQRHINKNDFEVWTLLAFAPNGDIWVRKQVENRGHQPDWSATTFIELSGPPFRPLACGVETHASQRVLMYILKQAMQQHRQYIRMHELEDRRKKYNRILDSINNLAYNGKLHIHTSCGALLEQLYEFPFLKKDDHIDSLALGIQTAEECYGGIVEDYLESEFYDKNASELEDMSLCP